MGKFTVEAEIVFIEKREGGAAIVFQSKRQIKRFAINLEGDEKLKVGDRVIVEVSSKPKRKRAKKSEV
ncbi:MAG: hypothetical protein KAJ19_13080 [Gammaproteobacteria bacterium]|nr:hypothetical protein [Gammaproteobacteria bacterium]